MTPKKVISGKGRVSDRETPGHAQFVVQVESETLVVHLDRQAFRRLLLTLEQLAESGDQQHFDKSGRQSRGRKMVGRKDVPITRLAFTLDQGSTG